MAKVRNRHFRAQKPPNIPKVGVAKHKVGGANLEVGGAKGADLGFFRGRGGWSRGAAFLE